MDVLVSIILVIFGFLQIVLFFKVWEMTNDVAKIREVIEKICNKQGSKVESSHKQLSPATRPIKSVKADIALYSWVKELKTNQEFQVMEIIDDNTYLCFNKNHSEGIKFTRADIEVI